jgi:hypothetical protein
MTFPVAVYDHSGGKCSITGGYIYRGSQYPALQGKYFFADYCSEQIGIMNPDNSLVWNSPSSGNNFSTFGQNSQKELFVAAVNSGKIFKITTGALATDETDRSNSLYIHPNPASEKVFIEGLEDLNSTADLFSTEGKIVLQKEKIENDGSVDITGIPAGVYYLIIKSGDVKSYSQKLIIK